MAYQAKQIAEKIIKHEQYKEHGEYVSNMKLQKLLYYQQGFHLAYFGDTLFDENIEAWMYGPVVPTVYDLYKDFGSKGLEFDGDVITLREEEESLFDEVMKVYGKFSAVGLMDLTHKETPWTTTHTGLGNIISTEKLRDYFSTKIVS